MPKSTLLAGLAVSLLTLASAHADNAGDGKSMLSAQAGLAAELLGRTLAKEGAANIMVSPASLAAALGLASLGASAEGKAAIAKGLGFGGEVKGPETVLAAMTPEKPAAADAPLASAVAIIFDDKLMLAPDALSMLASHRVKPSIEDLDGPGSVEHINLWVKETTRGAIPVMLDAPPGGGFVSLGALSFKARWKTSFDRESPASPFQRPDGSTVSVPMMHLTGDGQKFRVDEKFTAVDLAYTDESYSMVVIAARSGKGVGGADLKALASWLQGEKFEAVKGEIFLPRFSLSDGRDLMPVLNAIGLTPEKAKHSAFPGFTKENIRLSRVLQKTMIKVDENGTEAAAATAAITERSIDPKLVRVVANARFAFALRDTRTGLVLAAGLIGDPLLEQDD
ncbi:MULTISPECIES: serpin family protein [unclassified Rhizobium]|uniref:serpin family protein n=1 Tax=unclassified Rhizobium TaxID=2613769 RepID=UPI0007EB0B01|nr:MULTISPECIES: serpin family protein [unclassified Rhizobium]ANM14336.1 protease inhibitor serpin family protein [Rhizobium sp. N324]ANM20720.1 protease inhibitor serpin family protein [Rhizobium sp. N541]ANM27105.1 protease inhibitor serpin family protein [Rhizobium sp. N941]OYD00510.1 protease inhibitor serpin family protein [Rhizobium sp. N4311]